VIDNAFSNGSASSNPGSLPVVPSPPLEPEVLHALGDTKTPAMLDINTASQEQLAAIPGIDAETAAHVVAARDQLGGFGDTTELVTRAGVKPHIFAQLQGRISMSTASGAPAMNPTAAQPVRGPENGRRLQF
jgi:DNA uptake protein ComE-like DNA-binding protein